MQAQLADSLNTTAVRRRYAAAADDPYGIPTQGAASNVTYAARLVPAPGNEDTVDRDVQTHEASVLLPSGADIVGGDQLVIDATVWEVIGPAVSPSWETHLRVLVRRTDAT